MRVRISPRAPFFDCVKKWQANLRFACNSTDFVRQKPRRNSGVFVVQNLSRCLARREDPAPAANMRAGLVARLAHHFLLIVRPFRWPHRLARPRTPDSHSGDRGSNPLGATMNHSICHAWFMLCTGGAPIAIGATNWYGANLRFTAQLCITRCVRVHGTVRIACRKDEKKEMRE